LVSGVISRQGWAARIAHITDGTSYTICMGETRPECSDHLAHGWGTPNTMVATTPPINFPTCPRDPVLPTNCHLNNTWNTSLGFKSRHEGGAHFLLCDGSVRFLTENINYALYQRLGDRRDGEIIGEF
jgi:prepilin-type processing-associated H-X9-DG protein